MFLARLDNARKEVTTGQTPEIHRSGEEKSSLTEINRKDSSSLKKTGPFPSSATAIPLKSTTPEKDSKILRELNEYLFDLFDANCMEDYHKIDKFEQEALKLFDSEDFITNPYYEFSHEQYAKHQEFLCLFESLVEGFLRAFHYTPDLLYAELNTHISSRESAFDSTVNKEKNKETEEVKSKDKQQHSQQQFSYSSDEENGDNSDAFADKDDKSNALEIIDVIAYYTNFEKWCDMMRENIKLKHYFRSFEDRMKLAAEEMNKAFPKETSDDEEGKHSNLNSNEDSKRNHK
jgi:hypothetical protein